jgi:hypothetical protein
MGVVRANTMLNGRWHVADKVVVAVAAMLDGRWHVADGRSSKTDLWSD